jgi:hypothetical protein
MGEGEVVVFFEGRYERGGGGEREGCGVVVGVEKL